MAMNTVEPHYGLAVTEAFSKAFGENAAECAKELFWTAKEATDPIGKPYSVSTYTVGLAPNHRVRVAIGIHRKDRCAKVSLESEIPENMRAVRSGSGVMEGSHRKLSFHEHR